MSTPPDRPADIASHPAVADPAAPPGRAAPGMASVSHVEFKAALLLLLTLALVVASVAYLMYARGAFEPKQRLVLVSDDSEGVSPGMAMTFSGFPIGTVQQVELAPDGTVRILIDVPKKDAHWLRTSSVFTIVRGLVGGTAIRAYSGVLADPPLPPDTVRQALRGDATAELPRLLNSARELLDNLKNLTDQDSALAHTLEQVKQASTTLNSPQGAIKLLLGNERDRDRLLATLQRSQQVMQRAETLMTSLNQLTTRVDGTVARADERILGERGVLADVQTTVQTLQQLLASTRQSLAQVDALLSQAQRLATDATTVTGNAAKASADLERLRGDIDSTVRRVDQMLGDLQQRWPFQREGQVKLP
jgi:phospholipid/cholesterol/gamma-HCH transport system substrate-binding protein